MIFRKLASRIRDILPTDLANGAFDHETIDLTTIMKKFLQFWLEEADRLGVPYHYKEATPYLAFMAFLRKALSGSTASLSSESAFGSDRLDLLVRYNERPYPIELKIQDKKRRFTDYKRKKSLNQLRSYMDKLAAAEGWLLIFDKRPDQTWEEKIYWESTDFDGVTIHIFGC
jgi:hypothetical protein